MTHWFERAQQSIPGGVNSPVRAFGGVGRTPVFFEHAEGALLTDTEGKAYIDYVGSWGPLILGHAHPAVVEAVQKAAAHGLSFGAPTPLEVEMAESVCDAVPSIELVRMINSGTEATMTAARLARGFTERPLIIKFDGCYHGHADPFLVKAGSGNLTFSTPNSAGVLPECTQHTRSLPFNDLNAVSDVFKTQGQNIAAVIVEPVACNMNCVLPKSGFLKHLRDLCTQHDALLIFDEVITGFRLGRGGAQSFFDVHPDLTTLGKIVGGGAPVGALGGRKDIMEHLSPLGPVYQAGTLSGNPLAMAAGLETLKQITAPGFYDALDEKARYLAEGFRAAAHTAGLPLFVQQIGSILGLFFTEQTDIQNLEQVSACQGETFKQFFHGMLEKGIYLAPSAYEVTFVSAAHTQAHLDTTIEAAKDVFKTLV